jgi:hypothetical protein
MSEYEIEIVNVEWTYSPKEYFEAPFEIQEDGYLINIEEGLIKAEIQPNLFNKNNRIAEDLTQHLENFFQGVQVVGHKLYCLSDSKVHIFKKGGGKVINLTANIVGEVAISDHADVVLTDSKGNIVTDSRQERIERKKEFGLLAAKHMNHDNVVKALFQSYAAAVRDSQNELIHLYEIREIIKKPFKTEKTTRKVLKISNTRWKRLGELANNAPLMQGRHRGQNPGELRNATNAELSEARNIAQAFIYAYLNYIERTS